MKNLFTQYYNKFDVDESKTVDTKAVIEKWYKKLEFPKTFDSEFYSALNDIQISAETSIDSYDVACQNGKLNLLSYLYMCEATCQLHKKLGIDEEITVDTLKDIVVWTQIWSDIKGELYLGELAWLRCHLSGKLFRLGRLQFCMGIAGSGFVNGGVVCGDKVMEVHIPRGGKLSVEECKKSFDYAREFFAKYFADFSYKYFTCHSWLLDETLKKYLSADSNIVKFGDLFARVNKEPSNDVLRYTFRWNTTAESLENEKCDSSFAERIKKAFLGGEKFFATFGVIKK